MKTSLLSMTVATLGCALSAAPAPAQKASVVAQVSTPEVCTEVYQPVCATDETGKRRTYSNACFARLGKAKDITPGECPK
jgi:hypothetical protein